MFSNTISRTLAAFGRRHEPPAEEKSDLRAVFGNANGETPTPLAPPPARIPPHQRHLYMRPDDALKGYSMGSYRPAATMADDSRLAKKTAKPRNRAKASPKHA